MRDLSCRIAPQSSVDSITDYNGFYSILSCIAVSGGQGVVNSFVSLIFILVFSRL